MTHSMRYSVTAIVVVVVVKIAFVFDVHETDITGSDKLLLIFLQNDNIRRLPQINV